MRYIFCSLLACMLSVNTFAQRKGDLNYTIASWLNNKKAAVTLTFDDGIPGQYNIAVPLLNQYGFMSTFFVTVDIVNQQKISWEQINQAAKYGHEIANHALTHPYFTKMPLDSVAYESTQSNKLINRYVPSQKVLTHAYPYGNGGGNTDKDRAVRQTISKYFIGARATQNKNYPYNKYDFGQTIDGYYNVNSQMITDSSSMADFGKYIDETIAIGGWFCPTYHGIANGWIITPEKVFKDHLAELEKRKADIWIAPFKDVIKYHRERNSATLNTVSLKNKVWKLSLTDTLAASNIYNMPLTLNIAVNRRVQKVSQGSNNLPFTLQNGYLIVNALPGKEMIKIQFK